jgi:hypothetical protein
MELKLIRDYKTPEGLYYIDVQIITKGKVSKIYTYVMNSEYYFRKFKACYNKRKYHGTALRWLIKGNIGKPKEGDGQTCLNL